MSTARQPTYLGVFLQLAIGSVLSPLLIGIPIFAAALGDLFALASSQATQTLARPGTRERVGFVAIGFLALATVLGFLIGLALGRTADLAELTNGAGILTIALLAPLLSALCFAPLALAPFVALDDIPTRAVPVEAVRRWALAPLGSVLGTSALLAAHALLPFLVSAAVVWLDDDLAAEGLLAGLLLTVLGAPFTLRRLAQMNQGVLAAAPSSQRALAELRGIARAPTLVLPALLALTCAFAARPQALYEVEIPLHRSGLSTLILRPGVQLRSEYSGLRLEREGRRDVVYRSRHYVHEASLDSHPYEFRGRSAHFVSVSSSGPHGLAFGLILDDEGNRLDDDGLGSLDEIPRTAFALLALAALLGVALMAVHGRMVAYLHLVAAAQAGNAADVIRGRLRASGKAQVLKDRLLAGEGAALVSDDGAITIALPIEGAQVLAADPEALAREQPRLTLLSRGARMGSGGLREASAPFPEGGQLVVGDPEAALAALVATAHGRLAWLAIGTCLALTAACVAMSVGLIAL